MPTNDAMKQEFANAAEREQFERNRARAEEIRRRKQEEASPAPAAPADPVKQLEDKLTDEKKKGKFVQWLSKNASIGSTLVQSGIDSNKQAIDRAGSLVPVNPFQNNTAEALKGTTGFTAAAGVDVATAITNPGNTLKQIPSGVLNAWNEINEFGQSLDMMAADALGYYPTIQITDEQGNLDPKILNLADPAVQKRFDEANPLQIENKIEAPVSMTGSLVQGISQFMAPYSAYSKAIKGVGLLAKPGYWQTLSRASLAGFMADFTAFDPEMGRLTDMADEMGFGDLAIEYLKSDPDDTEMEARFKTGLEGLGLGVLGEVVFSLFRSGKAVTQTKDALQQRIDAMDRLDAEAAARIDEDIRSFGDPDGEKVIITPPPRARTQARMDEARARSPEEMDANVNAIMDEYNAKRDEFGETLTKAQEDELAVIGDRMQQAVRRRDAADARRIPTGEDRFYDQDFFELASRGADEGQFAMRQSPPNRERFLAEETVARQTEDGDMVGFRTQAGDVAVKFDRMNAATVITWDWIDNLAAGFEFDARRITLSQANEITSKVMALVEADSRASGSPTYYFEGRTDALSRIYTKLVPKLAERMGYRVDAMPDGAIVLTRNEAAQSIDAVRGLLAQQPVNSADYVARAQKRQQIIEEMNQRVGYNPQRSGETSRRAAIAMAQELESKGARFASMQGQGRQELSFMQRQNRMRQLREEGRRVFGKHFRLLEETGRIQFARRASDVDPNWADQDGNYQAVTMPGGQVFVFTETTQIEDMYGLVLHEMGIHSGLKPMLGEDAFNKVLDRVEELASEAEYILDTFGRDALSADERLYADSVQKARAQIGDAPNSRVRILEETLAYIVQNGESTARGFHAELMEGIVANIKAWLAKTFPGLVDRLNLNRADFDALALSAIRSEAIVAGRLIATFGRGARVPEWTEFNQAPVLSSDARVLGEQDRLAMQPEVQLQQHFVVDVPNSVFAREVEVFQPELLHGRIMDWMFRNVPDFDPFQWRDAIDLISQGQGSPEMIRMVRRALRAFQESDLGPAFEYRSFLEINSPSAMRFWEAARSTSDKPTTLVLPMEQRVFGPGSPDDNGFITTAERAIDSLGGQFADAESLTAEQWRKALRANGVTGEAFRFQVEPALELIGRETGDITRDELKEAMARVRPDIQTKSGRITAKLDDTYKTPGQMAPLSSAIVVGAEVGNPLLDLLPPALRERIVDWATQNLEDARDRLDENYLAFPGMKGEQDYSDYVSPGRVEGYEQELIIAPNEAKGYRSHNWRTDGVVGHIRTTDRRTAKGERVVFVDELQSDLHQDAVRDGYRAGDVDETALNQADKKFHELFAQFKEQMSARGENDWYLNGDRVSVISDSPADEIFKDPGLRQLRDDLLAADLARIEALDAVYKARNAPPRAPMKDWEKPFIRRVLQKAAQRRVSLVAFTRFDTLNQALKNDGTAKFYDERMPAHIKAVAQELGLKVEQVEISFSISRQANPSNIVNFGGDKGWGFAFREMDGGLYEESGFKSRAEAAARIKAYNEALKPEKVMAIRLTPEAMEKITGGVPMFSMKEAPGRMDDQLQRIVTQDIKEGRRGLSADEREALLGAAERWAAAVAKLKPEQSRELEDIIEQARTQADPESMRNLIEMMEMAKTEVPEPVSLLRFLRRIGGLKEMDQDYAGELRGRDLNTVNLMNNRTGRNLDDAALLAQEAGYIGGYLDTSERATIDDLLEAIDRELSGEKVYSVNDADWVMEAATREDMRQELRNLGVDPRQSRKQMMSEFERIANLTEGEPLTLRDFDDLDRMERESGNKPGIGLPAKGLLGGNEIRINFNAIQTADDIKSIIGQLVDAFSEEILDTRGQPRTNKVVIRDARKIQAWDALNERRDGTPLTDAQVLAAQSLYVTSAENVKAALDLAMKTGTDTAHYNARRAITLHRAIQAEIAGAKADASRALRAWSVPRSSTVQARRELNQVLEEYGGKLDPEEAARLRVMMDADPTAADKYIRSMNNKIADIGGTILRFAWLSGPQTHVMNMAGNSLTTVFDIGLRLMVGARGKILGDPELERQLSMAMAEYSGLVAGVRAQFSAFARSADYKRMGEKLNDARQYVESGRLVEGLKRGASALAFDNPVAATFRGRFDDRGVSGTAKYSARGNERAVSAEAFGMKQGTPQAKMIDGIGALLSAPTDFLGFQDDFFKGVNELAARYREAQRIVLEEMDQGLKREDAQARFVELVENPPKEVLEEARKTAQRRTFTEPVGEGTRTLLKAREIMNKLGFPMGHLLLPFIVTPSNILKYAFQTGPTGILFKEIREDLAAGGSRAALAQSRMLAGTALLIIGADMVAHGHMTGKAPADTGERELWERSGKQEYSIKVGDKWVQYRRMEPVSTMLAIGADLQNIMLNTELNDDPNEDFGELVGPVLGAAIQVVTSKTYLTSMSEFVRFTEDPERYGPGWIDRLFSSVTAPAGLAQIEEIQDPVIREASNVMERWMARTPGYSKDLPPSFDIWGRQRTVSSGLGQTYDALSPFTVKTQDPEPIDKELMRIGFYPRRPDKSITVQTPLGLTVGVNLRNRPDIWTRYIQLAGNEMKIFDGLGTKDYLNAVINKAHPDSAEYYMLPDSATGPVSKEWFINRRINQARTVARVQLQREFRADLQAMATAALEAQRASELRREALAPQ